MEEQKKPTIVLCAPLHDVATSMTFYMANAIDEYFTKKKYRVIRILNPTANKYGFLLSLIYKPALILYLGHGVEDALVGDVVSYYSGFPFVHKRWSRWLKNTIVFTYACLSGKDLGREAIRNGALAYFGAKDVMFAALNLPEHDYLNDFIDIWSSGVIALLEGKTTGEAYDIIQSRGEEYLAKYEKMMEDKDKYPNADWFYYALRWNLDVYQLLGDENATIYEASGNIPGIMDLVLSMNETEALITTTIVGGAVGGIVSEVAKEIYKGYKKAYQETKTK